MTMKVKYLGRTLGEASSWAAAPGEVWWYYDFKPAARVNLPECRYLQIDDVTGTISTQEAYGNTLGSYDTIETLRLIPKDALGD